MYEGSIYVWDKLVWGPMLFENWISIFYYTFWMVLSAVGWKKDEFFVGKNCQKRNLF